jgi:hypothetical protein
MWPNTNNKKNHTSYVVMKFLNYRNKTKTPKTYKEKKRSQKDIRSSIAGSQIQRSGSKVERAIIPHSSKHHWSVRAGEDCVGRANF